MPKTVLEYADKDTLRRLTRGTTSKEEVVHATLSLPVDGLADEQENVQYVLTLPEPVSNSTK
jgi:hypothetical protein